MIHTSKLYKRLHAYVSFARKADKELLMQQSTLHIC